MTINITSGPSNGSIQYNGVDKIIVDSGNVSVTGNSIVSGNLTVTGSGLTVGGSKVMTTALAVPEIISNNTADTGTITRYHTGQVLIQFYGFCFTANYAPINWAFYVNGSAVYSRSTMVAYEVMANPQFFYQFTSVGSFTVRTNLYGDTGVYDSQIIIWYL